MGNQIVQVNRAEIAEIESQIATAKKYPRDIAEFKEKLMAMATLDMDTAEGCYYALPRANKPIDGPSVRLAEIAFSCWGNCIAEAHVTNEDESFIYAVGSCRDLENNVTVRVEVRRRITYADSYTCDACTKWHKYMPRGNKCLQCGKEQVTFKEGGRYNNDMIGVTANATCAIAFRNAVFKVVPGAYIKPVFEAVKKVAVGDMKSLTKRRGEVIARIIKFGVDEERILNVLGRKSLDEVTFNDIAILIGFGNAIKDGDTTVEEAFPITFKESQQEADDTIKAEAGSKTMEAEKPEEVPETDEKAEWLNEEIE